MTARQYFRFGVDVPAIEIRDLPFIRCQWALNLMLGHTKSTSVAPASVVVLMQAEETLVDVEGVSVFKGTPYLDKTSLAFGSISPSQILIA
ncbi:hypothetical protein [Pseudomonas fluorescens]|uniref:Uncharacterized protein n=1 Tax=Pseudomonas fluorescens (strain Pf0-1) TaxID=205922 RepID=Q3KG04_PSEPF|nr:hypothetical protein [Pseudomonas fluorescens]ABA73302.1 hypothetical protein Pfl01_1559 [Pseudomonas fluorescens Pf0-1]